MSRCAKCGCEKESPFDGKTVIHDEARCGSFAAPASSERVPQYDVELRLAAAAVEEWKAIAFRLYSVRGCHKNEQRRIGAEAAYLKLAQNHGRTRINTDETGTDH